MRHNTTGGRSERIGGVEWQIPSRHGRRVRRSAALACRRRRRRKRLRLFMRRRSTIAFLMCLPLIVIIACLIVYPAFYSIYLSMLNKAQTRFIGLGNFAFLLSRDVFWMVVRADRDLRHQRGVLQGADRADHRASDQQSAGQGPAQMARHAAGAVGHPAGAVVARLVVAVRPTHSALQLCSLQPRLTAKCPG